MSDLPRGGPGSPQGQPPPSARAIALPRPARTALELVRGTARLRIEKRLVVPAWMPFVVPVASVLVALLIVAVLLAAGGVNPLEAYATILSGAFTSLDGLAGTATKAIPLILAGLAVAIAFRALLWNIGAEGQIHVGIVAATGMALFVMPRESPPLLLIPAMLLTGFLAGGLWALIPGLLKGVFKVNEIITSLMLNYVAFELARYVINAAWKDPAGYGFPGTAPFDAARFPRIPGTQVHLGLLIGLLAALALFVVLRWTRWGYEIRVMGENIRTARYAGINLLKNVLLVMGLSGGLAGLAGVSELCGLANPRLTDVPIGYGYTAIIVAWLARLNPWAVVLVAFLFAGLLVGGERVRMALHLPVATAYVLQGIILFAVLGGELFIRYRLRLVREEGA